MATISLRFDDEMKDKLDEICDEMGVNLTTLFMIYAKKVVRDRKIPFAIEAPMSYDLESALDFTKTNRYTDLDN